MTKSGEDTKKNHGTSKLENERKNCANMFPRVRKQSLLFGTGVCINYVSFGDHF